MDILEAYGLQLCIDWSNKLQGYFVTEWSHLWLSYKGRNNQIWVDSEPYMKHTATQLEEKNEPMGFAEVIFGNCFVEVDHECYLA